MTGRRIDAPRPGWFLVRLVRGGVWVPARIEEAAGLFSAAVDGKPCGAAHADPLRADGVMRIWLYGREVTQAEHDLLLAKPGRHDPRKPVDLRKMASLF